MQLSLGKKIIFYIFLIIFLSTLNSKHASEIRFKNVDQITVLGLQENEKQDLLNDLQLLNLNNIFFLKKFELTNKLEANKLIENYTIFKKYPSSIVIKVNKTKFLANVFNNGKSFVLGSNGKLIESIEKKSNLPNIFGEYDKDSFFNLLKSLKNSNFRISNIKNLYFFKSGRWDIETKLDVIIKLPKDNLKDSLNLSLDILKNNEFKKVKILDLRQHNQIIINEG
ncbi:cell division protein FtsQ [Candidatus Pelagibacter sp.]|nr:cell division protein FtsQ [Candidatus Pelagibacter sp.]